MKKIFEEGWFLVKLQVESVEPFLYLTSRQIFSQEFSSNS